MIHRPEHRHRRAAFVAVALFLGCASPEAPDSPEGWLSLEGPTGVRVGDCVELRVSRSGYRADEPGRVLLDVSGADPRGSAALYGDPGCSVPAMDVAVPARRSRPIYFRSHRMQLVTARAEDDEGWRIPATLGIAAVGGERDVVLEGPERLRVHECAAFRVGLDGASALHTIELGAVGGRAFADETCSVELLRFPVGPGARERDVYVSSTEAGTLEVNATLLGEEEDPRTLVVPVVPLSRCPDLTDDGRVDESDMDVIRSALATCDGTPCEADLNDDGRVDNADISILDGHRGSCPPAALQLDGPASQPRLSCQAHRIRLTTSGGHDAATVDPITVSVSASEALVVHADGGCMEPVSEVQVLAGGGVGSVYVSFREIGTATLTATSPGFTAATALVDVSPARDRLVVAGPSTLIRHECNRYDLSVEDPTGEPTSVLEDALVFLSLEGSGITYSDARCEASTDTVTITRDSGAAHFYLRRGSIGDTTVVASSETLATGRLDVSTVAMSGCAADVDADGTVAFADITRVRAASGTLCSGCPEDVNADGMVTYADESIVVGHLGPCP